MDLVSGASGFANIVGLLGQFKSERKAASDDEYADFQNWLDSKRHRAVLDEINSNHLLGLSIKHLLQDNHAEVMAALGMLDSTLLKLASRLPAFADMATAIAPNVTISDQALGILQQLDASGGSRFSEFKMFSGTEYPVMDANGTIEIPEARFAENDLRELCSLGLLIEDRTPKGHRLWHLTREAADLVAAQAK